MHWRPVRPIQACALPAAGKAILLCCATMRADRGPAFGCSVHMVGSIWIVSLGAMMLSGFISAVPAQSDPASIAQQARQAMAERRFADAAESYARLADSYPAEPSLQATLGMALHLSALDREAMGPLRQAASTMPSSCPAHFFLGVSLTRLGEFAEAIEPLRRAASLDPRRPCARSMLGDALEAVGEFPDAADAWRALGSLDASNPYAYAGLVRCHGRLAALATEMLKRRDPESAYVFRLLAHSSLASAQYPSAPYLFCEALVREPNVRTVHEAVAKLYRKSGYDDWAAVELERAASLPRTDRSLVQTAECAFAAGHFESIAGFAPSWPSDRLFWSVRANGQGHRRILRQSQSPRCVGRSTHPRSCHPLLPRAIL